MIPTKIRLSAEAIHNQRTALVKDMVAKESAAQDAKTAKLKALRLAKEAKDKAVRVPEAPIKRKRQKS